MTRDIAGAAGGREQRAQLLFLHCSVLLSAVSHTPPRAPGWAPHTHGRPAVLLTGREAEPSREHLPRRSRRRWGEWGGEERKHSASSRTSGHFAACTATVTTWTSAQGAGVTETGPCRAHWGILRPRTSDCRILCSCHRGHFCETSSPPLPTPKKKQIKAKQMYSVTTAIGSHPANSYSPIQPTAIPLLFSRQCTAGISVLSYLGRCAPDSSCD